MSSEWKLSGILANNLYGYINPTDKKAAYASHSGQAWLIDMDQHYALVISSGDVIFAGNHDMIKELACSPIEVGTHFIFGIS